MIFPIWHLTEPGEDNLGLACTADGLILGRTPLIERRNESFNIRERSEIERLLRRAYETEPPMERIMPALGTVARALNANDPGLARIAAVHLRLPNLPHRAARDAMEGEDLLIKNARDESGSEEWDPAEHPRAGTPPNPGWFAPKSGDASLIHSAENNDPTRRSDTAPSAGDDWVRLPPGDYIDELHDFLEWLANARPEDEKAIRAEIKRYYYDVGDIQGGDAVNRALSNVLDPGFNPKLHPDLDKEWRQTVLNSIAAYAEADPAEMGLLQGSLPAFVLPFPGVAAGAIEAAPQVAEEGAPLIEGDALEIRTFRGTLEVDPWTLRWDERGRYLERLLGRSLHPNFEVIDGIPDGIATSIKSIDLRAATYQTPRSLIQRLGDYINELEEFTGAKRGGDIVQESDIKSRVLSLAIPKGSMTEDQSTVIQSVRDWSRTLKHPIDIVITEF